MNIINRFKLTSNFTVWSGLFRDIVLLCGRQEIFCTLDYE